MDGSSEALSEARLAEIERHQQQAAIDGHAMLSDELFLTVAVSDLLAEVERLRAREAALVEVARAVAKWEILGHAGRDTTMVMSRNVEHIQEQARALLASADSERRASDGTRNWRDIPDEPDEL